MIALLEARRAGLLSRTHWLPNIVAGLVVGVVALPLAMAFAIASGARPEQGIATAIIGGVLVSLFGGTRLQIAGPTGAFIAILAGITAKFGIGGLQLATLMAGAMLLLMGFARIGGVIRFIPAPVVVGFTAGIGVIIFVGQWSAFFGLPKPAGEHFHQKLWQLLLSLPHWHGPTLALSSIAFAVLLLAPRLRPLARIPAPLIAMVIVTLLQAWLQLPGVATIGSAFGGLPSGLPRFEPPPLSLSQALELIGPAFTIAMLGAIEALLSAVVADSMAGTRHDPNQELIGQGIANVVAPLFGGFAVTGAIARTATNVRNGATGPLAGVVHSLVLVAVLLFLAPLAAGIPLAALAAILFVVAWNMSEVRQFVRLLKRSPRADRAILAITFALTVFADLVVAVNVGVVLAVLHFLRRMSDAVDARPVTDEELSRHGLFDLPDGVRVIEIAGPMFFGAAETVGRAFGDLERDASALVIRLHRVPFMDITGIEALEDIAAGLRRRGRGVVLCEANARVKGKLQRAGVIGGPQGLPYAEMLADGVALAAAR